MAKRNWSNSEADDSYRRPDTAHYAARRGRNAGSEVVTRVDFAFVAASFAHSRDANARQPYQPPIVGKSICR